jgi:hypothetical protein
MMARNMTAISGARWREVGGRLPWTLAVPLIGGLSLGLWLAIWEVAQLALAG